MDVGSLKASELLEKYGTQLAHEMLIDMLQWVDNDDARTQIEDAIEDLNILVQTDEKGLLLIHQAQLANRIEKIPPAYEKGCLEIWLFDDAFISRNKLANHYHGYRKDGEKTIRLSQDEVRHFCNLINNPQKLLDV